MDDIKIIVGKNIQSLRKDKNITQQALADKLNYTAKAVSKWERGESLPEIETMIIIADMFNVTVDYLLHENLTKIPENYISPKVRDKNNILFSALMVTIAWLIGAIAYVYIVQNTTYNPYNIFYWCVPFSFAILSFTTIKRNKKLRAIIYSIFTWTLIACFYIEFIKYNFFLIFLVGIPAQIAILLWSKIIKVK